MNRKLVSVAAVAAFAAGFAAPAFAASIVTGMTDTLSASPVAYQGKCPAVITFNGKITVTGRIDPKAPVEIGYQFTRSDGGVSQNQFFTITHPGTYPISTTWTLGGAGLTSYSGWESFKAWPTGHQGGFGYSFSNKAAFRMACKPGRASSGPWAGQGR